MRRRWRKHENKRVQIKMLATLLVCSLSMLNGVWGISKHSDLGSRINFTNAGFAWVTAMVGDDIYSERNVERESYSAIGGEKVEQEVEMEAPFTSIDSMLQWAIGHSDPEKLKDAAQDVVRMTPLELEKRRVDIKELMEKLRVPSDADLMKIAISDLQNVSTSVEDRRRALEKLLLLVEPIDNANDLNKLGGLVAVIGELDREEVELRVAAAAVLGMAAQNNPVVQSQALQLEILPKLIHMAGSVNPEEAVKAFYALSAIIRNYPTGHQTFYRSGGVLLLTDLLTNKELDLRLGKKALFLITDLAEQWIAAEGQPDSVKLGERLLKAVVSQTESVDLDTIHKALDALKGLFGMDASVRELLRRTCEVENVLERLRLQLEKLISHPEQEQTEFLRELEELRHEVVDLFAGMQTDQTSSSVV